MNDKIRVGAVNYLNAKPLIYGLVNTAISKKIILTTDYPSQLANQLRNDEIDIALLPVVSITNILEPHIISNYCIASEKKVGSVSLFSQVPIDEIQHIYLDYQSQTSVALLRILLKKYWNIRPSLIEGENNYIDKISNKNAGLIIGDRALEHLHQFEYVYDLSEAWYDYTKKPFVFATWVSNKKLPEDFINKFDKAIGTGLKKIDSIIKELNYKNFDLNVYFKEYIQYDLTEDKKNGMTLFLKMLEEL